MGKSGSSKKVAKRKGVKKPTGNKSTTGGISGARNSRPSSRPLVNTESIKSGEPLSEKRQRVVADLRDRLPSRLPSSILSVLRHTKAKARSVSELRAMTNYSSSVLQDAISSCFCLGWVDWTRHPERPRKLVYLATPAGRDVLQRAIALTTVTLEDKD